MTVIRPNGISGITSITSSGDAINFYKSDGTLGPVLGLNINATTGISTFAALNVTGVLTYEDVTSVDSVGIITARSDLSIADKIIHTGDTNTAIRFPAADTITAETSGSERVRIDASGRVMIGNTVATSFIGNSSDNLVVGSGSGGEGITVYSATDNQGSITFADGTSGNAAYRGAVEYNHTADRLAFRTAGTGNRMIIDSSGRLLLGTTTEGYSTSDDLTIATSGSTGMTIRSGTSNYGSIHFSDATSGTGEYAGVIEYSHATDHLAFYTASTQQMRIDSSGRLLLGTTTEGASNADNLTIADSGHAGITIRSGTSSYGSILFSDGTSGSSEYIGALQYNHSGNFFTIGTNGAEAMRLNSDGKLILQHTGRTTPFISGDGGICIEQSYDGNVRALTIRNKSTHADAGTAIAFSLNRSGSDVDFLAGEIKVIKEQAFTTVPSTVDGAMVFSTIQNESHIERMRIDSSGNMGLGTASPGDYLASAHQLVISDAASTGITIATPTSSSGTIAFADGTGAADNARGLIRYGHSDNSLQFSTNAGERMRIDSDGIVQLGNGGFGQTKVGGQSITGQDYSATLKIYDTRANMWGMQMRRDTGTGPNGIFVRAGNTSSNYSFYACGTNESDTHFVCRGDGQIGMGINSPAQQSGRGLHIHNPGGQTRIKLSNNVTGYTANDGFDIIQESSNDVHILNHENGVLKIGTNDAERMRILSGGGLTFNGDTAQANALDDYEEGTFTPGMTIGGLNTTATSAYGSYVKVGRLVTCFGRLALSSNGSGTGGAVFTGLPFTVADLVSTTSLEGGGFFTYQFNVSGVYGAMTILPNQLSTQASIYYAQSANGNMAGASESNIANNFDSRFVFSYQTA